MNFLHYQNLSNQCIFYFWPFVFYFYSQDYTDNLRNLKFGSTHLNADDCYNDAICPACPKVHTVHVAGEKCEVDGKSTLQENMLLF